MLTETMYTQLYMFFITALLVSIVGAIVVAMVDAKQNRTLTRPSRPTPRFGSPIPQH